MTDKEVNIMSEIRRGDIWMVDFGVPEDENDHKLHGIRPVVIVSNDSANRHSTVFHAVPLTSKIHKKTYLPTHIFISSFKAVGLRTNSIAQCEQLYRHEKRHTTNKDEWYVFENHHIALITKEQFYAVQKNKRKVIKPAKKQTVNMLKGKITCGCCGSSIHIHPEKYGKVYMCTHRKRYGKDSCNCLPVKVDDIYAAVLAVIKEQIQVFIDREKILKEHHNDSSVIRQEQVYTEAVNKCVKEMDRLMELKSGLYADYTEDLLDEKEYLQLNREYSQRIEKLKIQADEYRQAASQYESAEKTVAQLKAEMLRFKGKRKLTQEMVDLFVAQVRIYENKNLEIVLNYEDELKKFAELNMEREAG